MPRSVTSRASSRGISWFPIILILLIVLGGGVGIYFYLNREKHVPTITVEKGTVVRAFYATGVVRPDYEYVIKSKVQGALVGFGKREGMRVSKGELLARVDDRELTFEVERIQAELKEAQQQAADDAPQRLEVLARLNEAKEQTTLAKQNLDRTQTSFDKQAANFSDLDAARRSYVQWVNTVTALESQLGTWKISSQRAVEVTQANLRKAQANLAEADIVAPIDGVVLERYVENQEVVSLNQKIVLLAREDDLLMKAAVDEEDEIRTFIGQKVQMQLYAFQDTGGGKTEPVIMEGRVTEKLPMANATNKTFEVKVQFIDPPMEEISSDWFGMRVSWWRPAVRVGMTGELNFIERESGTRQAIVIPSSAVLDQKVYRPKGNHPSGAMGKGFEAVPVKVGVRTLDKVEITEGLSAGDVIVADAKMVAPVKLPPAQQPVVPTRTGDTEK